MNEAVKIPTVGWYNPFDWYWKADDGRIFSSKRATLVQINDPEYAKFLAVAPVTRWPPDASGHQTDESLQDVLKSCEGLFVNSRFFAAHHRNIAELRSTTFNGFPVSMDAVTRSKIALNATAAQNDLDFSTVWVGDDGVPHPLTNDDIRKMATHVAQRDASIAALYADLIDKVNQGTTTRQYIQEALANVV